MGFSLPPQSFASFLPFFRQLVCLLVLALFFCNMFWISNATPLLALAVCGAASFFLPGGVRFQKAMVPFAAFFLYKVLCDVFLFPEGSGFVMYRPMLLAFFGGLAVCHAFGDDRGKYFSCLLVAVLTMTLVVFLVSVCTGSTDSLFFHENRLMMWLRHPNRLGLVSATTAIVSLCFLLSRSAGPESSEGGLFRLLDKLVRTPLFLWTVLGTSWLMLWMSRSRTSFFGALFISALLLAPRAFSFLIRNKRIALVLLAAASLTMALAVLPNKERIAANRFGAVLFHGPHKDPTFRSRMPGWESALAAFREHPLLGNGPESFAQFHGRYVQDNYDRFVAELGERVVRRDTMFLPNAHNQYLMELSENGLAGLALLLLLFAAPLCRAARQRTLYGPAIPVLGFFLFLGIAEAPFYGSRAASFAITVAFLTVGYLAAMPGKAFSARQSRAGRL